MATITNDERKTAIARGRHALEHLDLPWVTTPYGTIGAAWEQLEIVRTFSDRHAVNDAVYALESMVTTHAPETIAGCASCSSKAA